MSSSPLYLAIVVVWLIVLVPMLLRKDAVAPGTDASRRTDAEGVDDSAEDGAEHLGEPVEETPGTDPDTTQRTRRPEPADGVGDQAVETPMGAEGIAPEEEAVLPPGSVRREPRSRIIARRRRRTTVLVLLNIVTAVAVTLGYGPWWVTAPPALLLLGHLALLREAAKADAEHHRARQRALRHRALARARREAEERRRTTVREAEVIELMERRSQVYDQYADAQLRAAGD